MKKITFNGFSGYKIVGTRKDESLAYSHLDLVSKVTASVESGGVFGTVINYDGTGMTAGIHQAIAAYPKDLTAQGPLWKLLCRAYALPARLDAFSRLLEELSNSGFELTRDGVLRTHRKGVPATGEEIRKFFGTPGGMLDDSDESGRAERIIMLFHELFSHEATIQLQLAFGMEHFLKSAERVKLRFSTSPRIRGSNLQDQIYTPYAGKNISRLIHREMEPNFDLAMCLYWSYSVNAPGMALKKMCETLDVVDRRANKWTEEFPKLLVQALGTCSYGRWDDDIDNGRYQRTRTELMKYFDSDLFKDDAIMPKNFVGA